MKRDNHFSLAKALVRAYPYGSVCSQGELRSQSLQLPRDVNDLRYDGVQLERHKPLKENLIASKCTHNGTRQAEDYRLSEEGYRKLKAFYKLTDTGDPLPPPLQQWQIDQMAMDNQEQVWSEKFQRMMYKDKKPAQQELI